MNVSLLPSWLPASSRARLRARGSAPALGVFVAAAVLSTGSAWCALLAAAGACAAGRGPGRARNAAAVLAGVLLLGVLGVRWHREWLAEGWEFVAVLTGAGMLPWCAGRFWRQYRQLVRAGWERAEQLERERQLVAEQARLRERARIAQDMHDLLGHDLSLIALSAGALKLEPGLQAGHRQLAQDIRARAGEAVERLGEVIGVLREESAPAPGPEEAASGVEDLVERARGSGLQVELHVEALPGAGGGAPPGARAELPVCVAGPAGSRAAPGPAVGASTPPPVVERAVHRVVQEALTNSAKHAPGAPVTVRLTHAPGLTTVRVDSGPVPTVRPGGERAAEAMTPNSPGRLAPTGGTGLISLDERVCRAGGDFAYGPGADHTFTVRATLPHTAHDRTVPARPGSGGAFLPQAHLRARRRATRALVAVVLPLLTAGVLGGGVMLWNSREASRSVLAEEDWARLSVGQDRAQAELLLPAQESVDRPGVPEPSGTGIDCRYYGRTADRFDDLSGDVFRVCFRGGKVVGLDAFGLHVTYGGQSAAPAPTGTEEARR